MKAFTPFGRSRTNHDWVDARTADQYAGLAAWLNLVDRLVVIEVGAGSALPTVRRFGERQRGAFIRINPFESSVANSLRSVSLAYGALTSLTALKIALEDAQFFPSEVS